MTEGDQTATGSAGIDYRRFFELAVDVMVVTRPDGRFELVNSAFAELLGVERDLVTSRPWTDFVHPDDREMSVEENTREFESQHRTMTFENRYVDAQGRVHWLNWNAELDPDTGLVYGTARDVTDQRLAREALEAAYVAADEARREAETANRSKNEFLSRMSHELRTPLNAILGFGQLMEFEALTEDQLDNVRQILRAGGHLLGLIDEVLDITRIEIGQMSISVEPVRLAESLAQVLSLLGPLAAARKITLLSDDGCHSSVHITADRRRLHQVLVNMLSNAIKYAPPGSTARMESIVLPDGHARISVIDNGPGIPSHLLDRLFVPFERIGAETTSVEGTGLGLALSKALTIGMGGRIGVDSSVGRGSTFWIELPIADEVRVPDDSSRPQAPVTDALVSGTMLYIEDNPTNTQLLERLLKRRPGVRLQSARLGREGLELAREQPPDLIALDLHLPDISGEAVLIELRSDPRTRHIPIVILSADATRGQIDHLLSIGAASYLTKPLDLTQLLTTIDESLATSESASRPGS